MAMIRTARTQVWTDPAVTDDTGAYWIYCITEEGCEASGPCKVGIAQYLSKRMSSLQGGNWRRLALCWLIRVNQASKADALQIEAAVLMRLRPSIFGEDGKRRLQSEWVEASPDRALVIASKFAGAYLERELAQVS